MDGRGTPPDVGAMIEVRGGLGSTGIGKDLSDVSLVVVVAIEPEEKLTYLA